MECSIREAAYSPELPADRMEVRITAFMMAAAPPTPRRANTRVKGDWATFVSLAASRFGSVKGSSVPMTAIAPM